MKALLKNNVVVDISQQDFPIHESFIWLDAPQGCEVGWVLIDNVLQEKPEEPKTPDEIIREFYLAIKELLFLKAKEKSYDNEQSIVSYTDSTNAAWKAEADAYIAWRDAVWVYAYTILDQVQNEEIEPPTIENFIASAPTLTWS